MSKQDYDIERGVYQTPSNDDDLYDDYDDEDGFGRGPVFRHFCSYRPIGFCRHRLAGLSARRAARD